MNELTINKMPRAAWGIQCLLDGESGNCAWPTAMEVARDALEEGAKLIGAIEQLAEKWEEEDADEQIAFTQAADQIIEIVLGGYGD